MRLRAKENVPFSVSCEVAQFPESFTKTLIDETLIF